MAPTQGSLIGIYAGNDSASTLDGILGLDPGDVIRLDRSEAPDTLFNQLGLGDIVYDDREPNSGS